MKKQPIITIILLMLVTTFAAAAGSTESLSDKEINARAEVLINRVEEIKSMDKSTLTAVEKKELRKEVKELKKEAREMGLDSRVSISIGAIIIILLILIIIL
ncbi:MAG: hypothetical protein ACFHWX_06985 [Bacteroidota bacterium]